MRLPYETSRDRVERPWTEEVLGESTLGGEGEQVRHLLDIFTPEEVTHPDHQSMAKREEEKNIFIHKN